jgi:aryl-alcohol dehydrogenase-like predicted oxidoreductase
MDKRRLGNSDLHITSLGVGAWAMGGSGWRFSWGPQDDKDSIAAIRKALESGMNWIDTAAVYGLGHSEEVVGRALEGIPHRPYIFTKCSRVWNERGELSGSLKAESLRRECEASLGRLKVDVIDLCQIHWPLPDEDIEEGCTTLAKLKEEGKVRYIGLSNFNVSQIKRAQPIAPITSLQPPYSILARDVEKEILPYCAEQNIGVIVYAPMRSGLLSGAMTGERASTLPDDDWRRRDPDFQEPKLSRNLQLVDLLRSIGERHGRTPGEVAIAWTLRHPAVTAAIVGLRRPEQVSGIIGAGEFRLSSKEIGEIDSFFNSVVTTRA